MDCAIAKALPIKKKRGDTVPHLLHLTLEFGTLALLHGFWWCRVSSCCYHTHYGLEVSL